MTLHRRTWTKRHDDRLLSLLEDGHGYKTCAKHLRCTHAACVARAKRLGVYVTRMPHTLSAVQVVRLLGVAQHSVITNCIQDGSLPATNAGHANVPRWRISWDALLIWMERQDRWMLWSPLALADPQLREWALELRQGEQWLTIKQVATRFQVSTTTVHGWIRRGHLPANRYAGTWVWSGDLVDFRLPCDRPYQRQGLLPTGVPATLLPLLSDIPRFPCELAETTGVKVKTIRSALAILHKRGLAQKVGDRTAGWTRV